MGLTDRWLERWSNTAAGPGPQHVPEPPRALTAAGTRVNLRKPDPAHTRHEQWQYASWQMRNTVPEMRFAGDFVASTLGRLRVFPAENRPRGEEPVPLEQASRRQQAANQLGVDQYTADATIEAVGRLNLNAHGASLLSRYAENLEYAGQGYLLGESDGDGRESWSIKSILECQLTQGGGRIIDPVSGMQQRELRDDEVDLYKLWTPDPAYYNQADAPIRGVLGVLRAMDLINQRGIAHDQSRISAGKGLFIPQELLMLAGPAAVSSDVPGVIDDPTASDFMTKLIEYMTTAIGNIDDPSAIVPLLLTGPSETTGGQPMKDAIGTFDLHGEDPKDLDTRYEALVMRFARGINLAPERIKGIGEATNQWSANAVTADEVKACVEPRAERMCDSLTAAYLHPTLRRMGVPSSQIAKVCLWFDPSELVQNPNRGEDAKSLFQAGELSGEALRRSTGFTEADKPSTQERLLRALSQERLANTSVPAILKLANGQLPTVSDLTALEQAQAQIGPRQVVDATPHRNATKPGAPKPAPDPKRIDSTPPVGERTQPATASQPGALGASAKPKPKWKLDRKLGRQLARVDADFTTRVLAAADTHVGQAIEIAAKRIEQSKGRPPSGRRPGDPERARLFPTGSDPRVIVAAAGRDIAGDLTDAALLDGAFDDLETVFHREAEAAADAVEAILDARLPDPAAVTAAAGRGVAAAIKANARQAWQWLSGRLRDHAADVLFGGRQPQRGGEQGPGLTPVSLIRGAAALLGGLGERHPGLRDDGTPASRGDTPTPASGPASGEVALGRLRTAGALVLGHEWLHTPSKNQLPGHAALDGEFFADWADPVLAIRPTDAWLGRTHYAIGDHQGCACLSARAFAIRMQEDADPKSAEVETLRAEAVGR